MSHIPSLCKLATIAIIVMPIVVNAQQPVSRASNANGTNQRFALFQGTYSAAVEDHTASNQPAVFKIDKATGDVWIFVTGVKDGKFIQIWSKIEN